MNILSIHKNFNTYTSTNTQAQKHKQTRTIKHTQMYTDQLTGLGSYLSSTFSSFLLFFSFFGPVRGEL